MTTIFVRTNSNELIEKINIEDRYLTDDCAKDYALFIIDLAITNALSIDSRTQEPNHFDPECACTPLIDELCSHCEPLEDKN